MMRSLPSEYTPFALPKLRTSPKLHWEMNIDWKTNTRRRPALNRVWAPGSPKSASVSCGTLVARLALHWPEYLRDWLLEEKKGKQLPACRLCCLLCANPPQKPRGIAVLNLFLYGAWVCSWRLGLQLQEGGPARPEIEFILLVFVSLYRLHFIIFINPDQRERRKEVQRREERKEVGEKRNTALG